MLTKNGIKKGVACCLSLMMILNTAGVGFADRGVNANNQNAGEQGFPL